EVARNLPKTSVQNRHVYTHLWQFVEKDVVLVDGVACYSAGRSQGTPIQSYGRYAQLYVNPVTGLLCKAKKGKRRRWYERELYRPGVRAYPGVQYHDINGVWYEVKVRKFVPPPTPFGKLPYSTSIRDEVLDRTYQDANELIRVYGGLLIAVSKRRMNKRQ